MFDKRVSGNHRDIIPAMSVMTPMIIRGRVIGTLGDWPYRRQTNKTHNYNNSIDWVSNLFRNSKYVWIEIYEMDNILNCEQRYDSEHDLIRMNNLSGWKRSWKNSGLTGNQTLIFAIDRRQPFIHCSDGSRGAPPPPAPYRRVWMTGPSLYRKSWICHCIELIYLTGGQAILSSSWLDLAKWIKRCVWSIAKIRVWFPVKPEFFQDLFQPLRFILLRRSCSPTY